MHVTADDERREVAAPWPGKERGNEMKDDVRQSSVDRYAVSQAMRWRAERDVAVQELAWLKREMEAEPKVKCVAEVKIDGERLERLAHDAAVELTGIDRDALLSLADKFDEGKERAYQAIDDDNMDYALAMCVTYGVCAEKLRQALGVVE